MDASKVKIQHYVPRLYLKAFTFDKNEKLVRVLNKETSKLFETNIENILAEKYFYDTESDLNQNIERALGTVESAVNDAYQSLLESASLASLDDAGRYMIAFFMAVQEHRTPVTRQKYRQMIVKMTEKVTKMMTGTATPEALERFRRQQEEALQEDAIKGMQSTTFLDTPKFAAIMMDMKWVLISNKTRVPFWTSDQPVTRFNPIDHGFYGNLGLLSRGIMIHFPLSPSLCLLLCDPDTYKNTPTDLNCVDIANVDFVNQWQVESSVRFLISNKLEFDLARKMVREHPEYANPDRDRVSVS